MHWIALAIVCAALIAVSYYSGKLGFGLLAGISVLLLALYFLDTDEEEKSDFQVDNNLLVLENTSPTGAYGDSWNYAGRITNNSSSSVTDVEIKITLSDCEYEESKDEDCVVIGEEVDFVPINIPSRQARDFKNNVTFKDAQPKGILRWKFELVGVRVVD